ncbi:MAG: hypothetical protein IJS66_05160 [Bacteroidales bacterium]|nr:hypothetical protein [Bacteroidales bacterium]
MNKTIEFEFDASYEAPACKVEGATVMRVLCISDKSLDPSLYSGYGSAGLDLEEEDGGSFNF